MQNKRLTQLYRAIGLILTLVIMLPQLSNAFALTERNASITVQLTCVIDNDFITGSADKIMMNRSLSVDNFDLTPYGYLTDSYGYTYDPTAAPTMLHLFIRAHEEFDTIGNFAFSAAIPDGGWITNFFGLGGNIMHFQNNAVPLNESGFGRTIDTITLEDGDNINVIMFSDPEYYYHDTRYTYFTTPTLHASISEPIELSLVSVHIFDTYESNPELREEGNRRLTISDDMETAPVISGNFDYTTDTSGVAIVEFNEAGIYFVSAEVADSETISIPLCVITIADSPTPTESSTPTPSPTPTIQPTPTFATSPTPSPTLTAPPSPSSTPTVDPSLACPDSYWPSFRKSPNNMAIVDAPTPRYVAAERFIQQLSFNWTDTLCQPIIVEDALILVVGDELMRIDSNTGDTINSVNMGKRTSYLGLPPVYGDGYVFVPMSGGDIYAFDAVTLEPAWIYEHTGLPGDSMSPITYSDGFLYAGFYYDVGVESEYICIDARVDLPGLEQKEDVWSFSSPGGFYFTGAYVDEVKNTLVLGSESDSTGNSKLYCLDKQTGALIDALEVNGSVRSSIAYDEQSQALLFVSNTGYFYSISTGTDGSFERETLKTLYLGGASTSTPVAYNARAYVGVQGAGFETGKVVVIDIHEMRVVYSVDMPGYPQCSLLLSTAYEGTGDSVYLYATYNYPEGGVIVITDKPGQTTPITHELYIPQEENSNYCMQSVICDETGTLYYCNDSGYLMALVEDETAIWGDVNQNGQLDTGDAAKLLRYTVGLVELSRFDNQVADFNFDGSINTADAAMILRRSVGL